MSKLTIELIKSFKTIGTHNGIFHADDVLSSVILKDINSNLEIIRSRDNEELKQCDFIYDVSIKGIKNNFDHHDKCSELREEGFKYSSVGLIWREIGIEYLKSKINFIVSDEDIENTWKKIDSKIIQGIDALDNGVTIEKNINTFNITDIVSNFTPTWEEGLNDVNDNFNKCVDFISAIWNNLIKNEISSLRAVSEVKEAYQKSLNNKSKVMELSRFMPWKNILLNIDVDRKIEFVIYGDGKQYTLSAVPKDLNSFNNLIDLPQEWAGKSGEDLSKITGVNDCIFCHAGRFMIINKTYEGIKKLAEFALLNN